MNPHRQEILKQTKVGDLFHLGKQALIRIKLELADTRQDLLLRHARKDGTMAKLVNFYHGKNI